MARYNYKVLVTRVRTLEEQGVFIVKSSKKLTQDEVDEAAEALAEKTTDMSEWTVTDDCQTTSYEGFELEEGEEDIKDA